MEMVLLWKFAPSTHKHRMGLSVTLWVSSKVRLVLNEMKHVQWLVHIFGKGESLQQSGQLWQISILKHRSHLCSKYFVIQKARHPVISNALSALSFWVDTLGMYNYWAQFSSEWIGMPHHSAFRLSIFRMLKVNLFILFLRLHQHFKCVLSLCFSIFVL